MSSSATDSEGGYLIPDGFVPYIVRAQLRSKFGRIACRRRAHGARRVNGNLRPLHRTYASWTKVINRQELRTKSPAIAVEWFGTEDSFGRMEEKCRVVRVREIPTPHK